MKKFRRTYTVRIGRLFFGIGVLITLSACAVPLQVNDPYGAKPAAVQSYPPACPMNVQTGEYECPGQIREVPVVGMDPQRPEGDTLPNMGRATVLMQPRQ